MLRMGSNQLRWLPRELARSPALEVLDIHNNHIHHLPRVLVNLFEKLKGMRFPPLLSFVLLFFAWCRLGRLL